MAPADLTADPRLARAARTLMLDAAAVECVSALRAEGIRAILLKGPVTAQWLYSDGGLRDYTDIDLLVARAELGRALQTLKGFGYRDTQADRSPNETATHARALMLDRSSEREGAPRFPQGLLVDLHWTFHGIGASDAEFWGVVAGSATRMKIAGTDVEIPSEPTRTLLLVLHAATEGAGVSRALADLDRGLERVADETWLVAHELARRLDALPRFIAGLRMRPLGQELIDRVHFEGDMDALSAMRAAGVPPVAGGLERLRTTHGLGSRLRLLVRELVPTPSFMRTWSPLARRGTVGLALAYAYRPIWLLSKLPTAARAHVLARREVQQTAVARPGDRVAVGRRLRRLAKRFSAARTGYRSARAALVRRREPERLWREGLSGEVEFWRTELPNRVASSDDYKLRADPRAPMRDPVMKMLIARIPDETVSIIDVGAGPLTALGKTYPGKTLDITATDPLAAEYTRIMRRSGIEPPVPPIACRGEALLERYRPETFDIAFARNALDHSADPARVIMNMVQLVKEGGFVVLRHLRSVGQHQFYRGLHQWNFDIEEGEFIIWRPGGVPLRLSQILNDGASIDCSVDSNDWLVCVITKAGSPA